MSYDRIFHQQDKNQKPFDIDVWYYCTVKPSSLPHPLTQLISQLRYWSIIEHWTTERPSKALSNHLAGVS